MNDPENAATPSILAKIDRIKGTEQAREGGSDKQEASVPLTAPRPPPHGLWAPASKDQGGWPCSTQAPHPRPPWSSSLESALSRSPQRPSLDAHTAASAPAARHPAGGGGGGERGAPHPHQSAEALVLLPDYRPEAQHVATVSRPVSPSSSTSSGPGDHEHRFQTNLTKLPTRWWNCR